MQEWSISPDDVLRPLRVGRSARYQLYDWPTDTLAEWQEIAPGGVAIVDGIVATRRELSDLYDLRVWLTCRRETRIPRLMARAGASIAEVEHWLPSEDDYVEAHAPRTSAHFVVHSIQR